MITKNKDPRFSYLRRIAALFVLLATLGMLAFRSKNTNEINIVKSSADTTITPKKLFDSLERRNFDTMNAVYQIDKKPVSKEAIKNLTTDKVETVMSWVEMRNGKYTTIIDVTTVDPKRLGSVSLDKANPIYYIDGKEVDEKDFKSVNPNDIQSINVWKGEKAVAKFGEKGIRGVIDVRTKKSDKLYKIEEDKPLSAPVPDTGRKTISFRVSPDKGIDSGVTSVRFDNVKIEPADPNGSTTWPVSNDAGKPKAPLYMVDGKEVVGIQNINPNDIFSISVWKDSSATARFGEKGKNGVIDIRLKNPIKPISLTP